MHAPSTLSYNNKPKFYAELRQEIEGLADRYWLTALANATAALKQHLPQINWVGFYLLREGQLTLGPFQGLPACTQIALGKGVCGNSASQKKTILVDDVDQFPGHIVCDSASRSEIVIPLILEGSKLIGVLDIDSPDLARFDKEDQAGLEAIVSTILKSNVWPSYF